MLTKCPHAVVKAWNLGSCLSLSLFLFVCLFVCLFVWCSLWFCVSCELGWGGGGGGGGLNGYITYQC